MIVLVAPITPFYEDLAAKLGAKHVEDWLAINDATITIFAKMPTTPVQSLLKICLSASPVTTGVHHFPMPVKLHQLQTFIKQRQASWLTLDGYIVDTIESVVHAQATGQKTALTERELSLITYLAAHPAGAMKEAILSTVWQYDGDIDSHTLESHLHRLRQKLPVLESHDGRYLLATPTGESGEL